MQETERLRVSQFNSPNQVHTVVLGKLQSDVW